MKPQQRVCADALTALADNCAKTGYRGLAVLAGPASWSQALRARQQATRPAQELAVDCARSARHLLGAETGRAVVDATQGLDPDTLGIAAGTLRAGGLLLLLTPPLDEWPDHPDPVLARWTPHPFRLADTRPRFVSRLVRRLGDAECAVIATPAGLRRHAPPAAPSAQRSAQDKDGPATADQARAVDAVCAIMHGRARRPLVLTADRGRGKSTALGIAAARILRERPESRIIVTAPRREAAAALFRAVAQPAGKTRSPRFLPADELLRSGIDSDLLLVDEAAGLPATVLEALLRRHHRVVFATTTHGYEGSGRGFSLRFAGTLDRLTPAWRRLELATPIRWLPDDPLEKWISRTLLLDAEASGITSGAGSSAVIERLDRDRLAATEPRLRAVFGLLVEAHYQTRPSDLRQMLDAPGIAVWAATIGNAVAAVAVTDDEGPLPGQLVEAIWLGRRRLRGNLLPQSLVTHAGLAECARLRCRRVVRIAVDPGCRRRGMGRALLRHIETVSAAEDMDAVGTSFGATAELLRFWTVCGYHPVRVGMRRDTASGSHSVMLLRPLTDAGSDVKRRLQPLAASHLRYHLPRRLAGLDPAVAAELLQVLPVPDQPPLDAWWSVAATAVGNRSIGDAGPEFAAVIAHALASGAAPNLPASRLQLLIRTLLQGTEPALAATTFGLPGRRAVESEIRAAARELVALCAPAPVQRYVTE